MNEPDGGQAAMAIARLAAALAPNAPGGAAAPQSGTAFRQAPLRLLVGHVVTAHAGTPGSADVTTDGVNTRTGVPCLAVVANGDVVFLLEQTPMLVVLGKRASW